MARTSFNPAGKNAETLVVEWLNRTNKRRIRTGFWGGDFRKCRQYWLVRGVDKQADTYYRAFRRMRERGYINATKANPQNNIIKVLARPEKVAVTMRHTHDRDGNRYGRRFSWNW